MPSGSEICRQLQPDRSPLAAMHVPQCQFPLASFFWLDTSRTIRDMSGGEMPQPALDPIAGHRVPYRTC